MEIGISLRKNAAPLNVHFTISPKTGDKSMSGGILTGYSYCPLIQTYDNNEEKYIVDRKTVPTVILPYAMLDAQDGSVSYDMSSDRITNFSWMVQKSGSSAVNIQSSDDWEGLFAIAGSGEERGGITLTKNIQPGESWMIWLEADFVDSRSGSDIVLHLTSDVKLTLSTNTNTESEYTMSIDCVNGEIYQPLMDKRIEFDYKKARGIIAADSTFTDDGKTYLRSIVVKCRKGANMLTAGTDYTIKIERYTASGWIQATANNREINSIDGGNIVFDLRWMAAASYRISCVKGTRVLDSKMWGYARGKIKPEPRPIYGTTFDDNTKQQVVKMQVSYRGKLIEYPEAYMNIEWTTKRENGESTYRAAGERMSVDLTDTSVVTDEDRYLNFGAKIDDKGIVNTLTDESGNPLTDESGNPLIE